MKNKEELCRLPCCFVNASLRLQNCVNDSNPDQTRNAKGKLNLLNFPFFTPKFGNREFRAPNDLLFTFLLYVASCA